MSRTTERGGSTGETDDEERELLRLNLDIWHRDCWTLEVTERADAGLLGHGAYTTDDDTAKARFTVFGDSHTEIDALLDEIDASPLTERVLPLHDGFATDSTVAPGNATQEIFVEYYPENSIDDALASRGFIREESTRIKDGIESWSVALHATRAEMKRRLDEVREEMDAEITITQITANHASAAVSTTGSILSERQRQVFELAQERDYYSWPRQVSAQELAAELDISKTTFLEHLRKAEGKLLDQYDRG